MDATESDWYTVRVMLQQGEYELHRGQFDKALAYMDKAVKVGELCTDDVEGQNDAIHVYRVIHTISLSVGLT